MPSRPVSALSTSRNDLVFVWLVQSEIDALRTEVLEVFGQGSLRFIRRHGTSFYLSILQCKSKLKCGIHVCGLGCHERNKCPPCAKKSKQSCLCGNSVQERNCDALVWQCNKICNKLYPCGLHKCQLKCHIDECGDCQLGLPRECPCGKQVQFFFQNCLF